jgi:hypothetical protein
MAETKNNSAKTAALSAVVVEFDFTPLQAVVYLYPGPPASRPTIQNPPRCHLDLLRQTLRPSKESIWLSSTLTRTCSDGLPPKLTCSGTSPSARLRFTKWCSLSNDWA